jgi:hypothetical protein
MYTEKALQRGDQVASEIHTLWSGLLRGNSTATEALRENKLKYDLLLSI